MICGATLLWNISTHLTRQVGNQNCLFLKGKVKDGDKSTDGKGKKDNKKTVAKDESEDVDSPRKRRSRTAVDKKADEKKKEEEKEERMTKRMTREDTAKLKEESKVKAEEERSRRSTSKKGEPEVEEKEEASQKRKVIWSAYCWFTGSVTRKEMCLYNFVELTLTRPNDQDIIAVINFLWKVA